MTLVRSLMKPSENGNEVVATEMLAWPSFFNGNYC